jgi:hypothetical protein
MFMFSVALWWALRARDNTAEAYEMKDMGKTTVDTLPH